MDPLHAAIATLPLAAYLLRLGALHFRRRATLINGERDNLAIAVAAAGYIMAGPMELFMPEAAATRFGAWIWLLLLSFYGLAVMMWILMARPRLVIYNQTPDGLRPVLEEVVASLDPQSRWAGESLLMPELGVQLHVDSFRMMRCVSLVAIGPRQSYAGWRQLQNALADKLAARPVPRNPLGMTLAFCGLSLIVISIMRLSGNPELVMQRWDDFLRR